MGETVVPQSPYSAFIQKGAEANQRKQDISMMACIGPDSSLSIIKRKGGTIVPTSDNKPIGFAILLMEVVLVFTIYARTTFGPMILENTT